jgi:hypothetical protein
MHIRPGKVCNKVTLLPRGRVASRQAKVGVISGLWGDFGFKGLGATVMGEKGGRLPSRLDCFCPRDGWLSAGWIAEGPGRSQRRGK